MKYKIFLISLLLLLVGCGGGDTSIDNNLAWKQGVGGVDLFFETNSLPPVLYSEESYELSLELTNRGAYPGDDDSLDVDLYFIGFDENVIQLDVYDSETIDGSASPTNPLGGIQFYSQEFDVEIFDEASVLSQDIKVVACYEYETNQQITVCVDPDPVHNDEDSCSQGVISGLGAQGAPVAVTSMTIVSSRGKVRATMIIANVGSGSTYREGDGECLNPLQSDKNIVEVIEVSLGGDEMDCNPDEYVRIGSGGRLTCSFDGLDEDRPAFKTTLNVNLFYNYKTSIQRSVQVERIE